MRTSGRPASAPEARYQPEPARAAERRRRARGRRQSFEDARRRVQTIGLAYGVSVALPMPESRPQPR